MILWLDGQQGYDTTRISEKWRGGNTGWDVVSGAGRDGRYALDGHATTVDLGNVLRTYPADTDPQDSIGMGWSVFLEGAPSAMFGHAFFFGDDVIASLYIKDNGHIRVLITGPFTTIDVTSKCSVFPFNQWNNVEWSVTSTSDPLSGEFAVRVNHREVTWAGANTGLDTGGTPAQLYEYQFGKSGAPYTDDYLLCDVYVSDGNFYGDCVVETLFPDGDGTYTEWELGFHNTGSHYSSVLKDHIHDTQLDELLVSYAPGANDSYTFDNLDGAWSDDEATPVQAVQVTPRVDNSRYFEVIREEYDYTVCNLTGLNGTDEHGYNNSSSGGGGVDQATVRVLVRYSGSDSTSDLIEVSRGNGPTRPGNLKTWYCWDTNPSNGDAPWTYAQVNASEFGVTVASTDSDTDVSDLDPADNFLTTTYDETSSELSRLASEDIVDNCTGLRSTSDISRHQYFFSRAVMRQIVTEVLVRREDQTPANFRCGSRRFPQLIGQ